MEKIIETKKCKSCENDFSVTDSDKDFLEKISPSFAGKKYSIPTPTFCPDCRFQRRAVFRNLNKLYKRKSDATDKSIISIYSPDKQYKVYENEERRSDKRDAMDYGHDVDFSKSFFQQFDALIKQVPKISLSTEKLENSDYVNYSGWVENCYLVFLAANDKDCYYSCGLRYSTNSVDCAYSQHLQNCYQVLDSLNCYNCRYLNNAKDCRDCSYGDNLIGCKNCLFCTNLVNADFHIFNEKVTKEEFESTLKQMDDAKVLANLLEKYKAFTLQFPKKENHNVNSENCFGEYILNSSHVDHGFDVSGVQDSKYVDWLFDSKNCMDVFDRGETAEQCYECYKIGKGVTKTIFSAFCISSIHNLIYCYDCVTACSDCFGCTGLKHKKYCILNKQYTKEEYEKLVGQIITQMEKAGERGENFPVVLSTFAYNETVAQTFHPMKKEDALARGYKWQDLEYAINIPEGLPTIPGKDLPTSIDDVTDDILEKVILCEKTGKPYRIIKQELDFYRKHHLPLPTKHHDTRKEALMKKRMPKAFHIAPCSHCGEEMLSAYGADSGYNVRCEACYTKEIYG